MDISPIDRSKVPRAFWSAVQLFGIQPAVMLKRAGLSPALYLDPEASVTTSELFAIVNGLEALSPEPKLSLRLAQAMKQLSHTPISHAATYARSFRDGLVWVQTCKRLGTCEELIVEEQGDHCVLYSRWPFATGPEPLTLVECGCMFIIELGRRGTNHKIIPQYIDFECQSEANQALANLFGCPIRYGAQRNQLVLKARDLDRPFPGHNSEFLNLLTPALQASLRVDKVMATTGDRIKALLKGRLAGEWPELSDVAHQLAMSERTMQRRIEEEGTTFRQLLTEAKQELGRQLISDRSIEIDKVAFLLGFQDTSSFYRAFRDWEGMTPSEWRDLIGDRRPTAKATNAADPTQSEGHLSTHR